MLTLQGRPPFRADHVGSLLRPQRLAAGLSPGTPPRRWAMRSSPRCRTNASATWSPCRKRSACRWSPTANSAAAPIGGGSSSARRASRSSRPRSSSAMTAVTRSISRRLMPRARSARAQPLALDEFMFLRGVTKRRGRSRCPRLRPCISTAATISPIARPMPKRRNLLRRSGENLSSRRSAALAKAGCRYVQLDEVAVALLCDPAIRDADHASRQQP